MLVQLMLKYIKSKKINIFRYFYDVPVPIDDVTYSVESTNYAISILSIAQVSVLYLFYFRMKKLYIQMIIFILLIHILIYQKLVIINIEILV